MFHHFVGRCRSSSYGRIIKTVMNSTIIITHPQFHFLLRNPSSILIRFVSSTSTTPSNPKQFTVDYLINTCGLSPESALKASQRLLLRKPPTTTNPDSVLSLFKTYGFTQPQISKLISDYSLLLLANPEKTLKPKLDFFNSIGISGPILGNVFSKDSNFLKLSLENQIIPSINFLGTLGLTHSSLVTVLKQSVWVLHNAERKMRPNIAILRHNGVPESNILNFLTKYPHRLRHDSVRFSKLVFQLIKLGVDPSTMAFCRCLNVIIGTKKPRWDENIAVYRSFGWLEDEILSVFKKQPCVMAASAEKIGLALDFFMNRLKWTQEDIARTPNVISLSLNKRVIPRCNVLVVLLSKGLIKKESMGQALKDTEDVFLKKFVTRYQDELPNLFEAYQSKAIVEAFVGCEDGGL